MESKIYEPVWREKFQVRSFDIGLNHKMRISSLCSHLQEVAGNHATHLDNPLPSLPSNTNTK